MLDATHKMPDWSNPAWRRGLFYLIWDKYHKNWSFKLVNFLVDLQLLEPNVAETKLSSNSFQSKQKDLNP